MTKSTITRERAQQIFLGNGPEPSASEERELARMALAAMESEPVAVTGNGLNVALSLTQMQIDWICNTCASIYNTRNDDVAQGYIDEIRATLERLAAMDSEPYGFTDGDRRGMIYKPEHSDRLSEPVPVYRHAQPAPAVPDDVLDALQKVARIRLDLNDFDGDRRGIADCLCDAEEALIEVVNRRAAMLAAAPQSPGSEPATVPGTWIPVSERMPEDEQEVLTINRMGHRFVSFFDKHSGLYFDRLDAPAACCIEHVLVTHWMPLPAAQQEVKGE